MKWFEVRDDLHEFKMLMGEMVVLLREVLAELRAIREALEDK